IAGTRRLALAYAGRDSRFDLTRVPVTATRSNGSFHLSGQATQVWGGHLADAYVVAARTSGHGREGITLFVVPASAPGLTCVRQHRVDSLNAALLTFEGVEAHEADVLGALGHGHAVLARVID